MYWRSTMIELMRAGGLLMIPIVICSVLITAIIDISKKMVEYIDLFVMSMNYKGNISYYFQKLLRFSLMKVKNSNSLASLFIFPSFL